MSWYTIDAKVDHKEFMKEFNKCRDSTKFDPYTIAVPIVEGEIYYVDIPDHLRPSFQSLFELFNPMPASKPHGASS
jgi:hypothetical protein